jgi:hypothetical protein
MVLGLIAWISYNHEVQRFTGKPYMEEIFMIVLNLLDNFSSKMMFLNSEKPFQSIESEYSLRTDLGASRNFLFYRFETNQR